MSKRESPPSPATATDAGPVEAADAEFPATATDAGPVEAADAGSGLNDPVAEHVRWAVANWPQIDPEVEGIVTRVEKVHRHLQNAFRAHLRDAGLTKEEWKVLMALHNNVCSHGWLCRDLDVSTGAMTNRLDKLEHRGLIRRGPDPQDRRGVLLELTAAGEARLEEYIDAGAGRERELLASLTPREQRELNRLLSNLLISLLANEAEVSSAGERRQNT